MVLPELSATELEIITENVAEFLHTLCFIYIGIREHVAPLSSVFSKVINIGVP